MKTIRWGMIGAGDVTEVKSGPALQQAEHSVLVAVMRRTAARAEDYARRHGVARWYADAEALIHDPEVDAVYVATPPGAHLEYALAVAQAGKPIYVEKPMARTLAECETMIAACRAAEVPLFVAYYRRALPRFLKVKTLLEEGAIGEPRCVSLDLRRQPPDDLDPGILPWRFVPAIAGGGLLLDIGSHMLDLLDFLLGPIGAVRGTASNQAGLYPAEDMVSGQFEFESGLHGTGMWCFSSYDRQDRIEIVGSQGRLVFACFENEPIVLHTAAGQEAFDIPNPPHIQQPLIQTIVLALNGVGECPSSGETAARTSRVMDALLAEYRARHGQP